MKKRHFSNKHKKIYIDYSDKDDISDIESIYEETTDDIKAEHDWYLENGTITGELLPRWIQLSCYWENYFGYFYCISKKIKMFYEKIINPHQSRPGYSSDNDEPENMIEMDSDEYFYEEKGDDC